VSRADAIKDGTEQIGSRTKVSIIKNKIAPPFRIAEFDMIYGKGISKYGDILDLAVRSDLIQKGGAWFTINDERFQGRENALAYLREHQDYAEGLEQQVRAIYSLDGAVADEDGELEEEE